MAVYIIKKLLNTIPTLFGVILVVFVLFNVAGGDPCFQMVGKHATVSALAECHAQYGYDQPKAVQFVHLLKSVVTFDYGVSYASKRKISDMILAGIGPSLSIAVPAFLITTILSILIGLVVSYFRGKSIDRWGVVLCVIGMSFPMLAYILFGQYYFAYKLGLFPISGYEDDLISRVSYVALPVLIWIVVGIGYDV